MSKKFSGRLNPVVRSQKTPGKLGNGHWTTHKRVRIRPKYSATFAFS